MHELSIAQNILEIVCQYTDDEERNRVRAIHVHVGRLSGVFPDSLRFCWEAVVSESPLKDAMLVVEDIPIEYKCLSCGGTSETEDFVFICQSCFSPDIKILKGNELNVTQIELSDNP